jgi:hypothetical protein
MRRDADALQGQGRRSDAYLTLVSLPDDAFLLVIAACGDEDDEGDGVPLFGAVMGLGWDASPRECGSSSTGCSLSWAFRASPSCSVPIMARGASR